MKIKAIFFDKPYKASLRELKLPPCGENEIIAQTIYSFVSPGTELRVFSGKQSDSKFPLIPGYSWVGKVIKVGNKVKGWQQGDKVSGRNAIPIPGINSTWGGQASHHRCNPGHDIVKLPNDADPWEYVHAEVASISYRGICSAYPLPGETAVVIGQGMIGTFNTKWLLVQGARVIAVDLEDYRLELAKRWGCTATVNARNQNVRDQILSYCDGEGVDIVVESSASLPGAKLAASLLRKPTSQNIRTRYNVGSMHSNANLWPRLVYQASHYPATASQPHGLQDVEGAVILKPSDRSVSDRMAVVEHIHKREFPISDIIDSPTELTEVPKAYNYLQDNPDKIRGVVFKWSNL